jgi:hypothetical protein
MKTRSFLRSAADVARIRRAEGLIQRYGLSQTGGKTWGILFQRSTSCSTTTRNCSEAGLDPASLATEEMAEYGQKPTKRDASGKVTQWADSIVGISLLAVSRFDENDVMR